MMIKVTNLSKSFNNFKAVDAINLSVKKGEIFGLLGPNGAGKSTLINMLSTISQLDAGTITLNGIAITKNKIINKNIIGVVPQEIALYANFSAYDNLLFFGRLYKIDTQILKKRIDELLQLIGLEKRKNDLIKNYSGGMKRRINIAAALLHQPKIVLMDEPTVGVDPQSRNQIFEVIETLNKQGLTIIYTTHYMEEVERLCDTIAIMDSGKIIAQGTLKTLQNQSKRTETLTVMCNKIEENQFELLQKQFPFKITKTQNTLIFYCNSDTYLNEIITFFVKNNLFVTNIKTEKANLESIFLELTGKSLRD